MQLCVATVCDHVLRTRTDSHLRVLSPLSGAGGYQIAAALKREADPAANAGVQQWEVAPRHGFMDVRVDADTMRVTFVHAEDAAGHSGGATGTGRNRDDRSPQGFYTAEITRRGEPRQQAR